MLRYLPEELFKLDEKKKMSCRLRLKKIAQVVAKIAQGVKNRTVKL